MRFLYTLGVMYIVLCAALLYRGQPAVVPPVPVPAPPAHPNVAPPPGNAAEWYGQIKPFCNSLEVESHLRFQPPPVGADGAGYAAACLALAGKIDQARERIVALPEAQRTTAVGIVFEIGHPVADAGDDKSAGPIMELVVEFWPNHYMALYHAGASEFILGQPELARKHLESFLQYYHENDGWRTNALDMLHKLGAQ
ncbi:MAG TPA: hypothetical protein VMJ30_03400 [Gemmatimonadales bacterium]|nr:hypothetical protein [Gemmatimonadales bacterium]